MAQGFATDVLIVGCGAAGLTLAIDLARRGVDFRLIDRIDAPFSGSRGKGLQPRTQEIFEDLGFIDRITAAGGPYPPQHRVHKLDGTSTAVEESDPQQPTAAEPYNHSLMVPQFLTEGVMRARLLELGHKPQFGCELSGFDQDHTGVTARVAGPNGEEVVRARYLIGADGGRSFVRQALKIGFPGETLGVRAAVADVTLTGLTRDAWHRFGDASRGQLSLCPLMGTELFQLQGAIPFEGEVDFSAAGLTALVAERSGRDDILISAVAWASAYTMSARLADQYRIGRVFLVGDAAHVHPPTGGQGLNTSVQDAYNLGWKLAAVLRGASDALLDSYEEERRPIAAGVLGLATKLLDAAGRGDMRRGRETRQLDLGYAGSSLVLESSDLSETLLAGDRAPDAPLRGAGGQPTRLFYLCKGSHWTLLTPGDVTPPAKPRAGLRIHRIGPGGDVFDDGGHFAEAYALAAGASVLVRPDGYIAAIIPANATVALEPYLEKVGLAA